MIQQETQTEQTRQPGLRFRAGPSGVHLFDRTTGLNCLFDEVAVPPARWATAPRQVSIALTNACELACAFCYAPKSSASLSVEPVCAWLVELQNSGCLGVGLGGGEPTLHPRFVEICRFASSKTDMAVTYTTHAHRIDNRLAEQLHGYVHFIRVSVDGTGQTYERIRGRPFSELLHRLAIVRRICRFGINVVVNQQTVGELDAVANLASESDASEILLLPEQPVRGTGGIDPTTRAELEKWVGGYTGGVRLAVSVSGSEGLPVCDPLSLEVGLRAYAHIDAFGHVKRSSFDSGGVKIGPPGLMHALSVLQTRSEEMS